MSSSVPTFAPRHRAERLHALLRDRADLAPADFAIFHNDTLNTAADGPVAVIRGSHPARPEPRCSA